MADFKFDTNEVVPTFDCRAARAAVLAPLANMASLVRGESRKVIGDKYNAVLRLWRNRLAVLGGAGWKALQDHPERVGYYRNCPPYGIRIPKGWRYCRQQRVCPWCYMKKVSAETHSALGRVAAYAGDDWRVYAITSVKAFQIGTSLLEIVGIARSLWSHCIPISCPGTASVTNLYAVGSSVCVRFSVAYIGPPDLKDRVATVREFLESEKFSLETRSYATEQLVRATSYISKYPIMLMAEDAELTANILNEAAHSRLQMVRLTGGCIRPPARSKHCKK